MGDVRFGTIGTSMITGQFLEGVAQVEGVRLEGVYSRSLEKARAYGEPRGARLFFDSLDDLAACPDIDAVYIASPNLLHAPQALQMIAAGKHVLVEKPFGTNLPEVRSIIAAAKERGVCAMEAMRLAHDPGYGAVREILPRLGPIRRATFRYDQYSSRYDLVLKRERSNIFDPSLATGALMDLGIYPLSAMVNLFGAPDDLLCTAVTIDVTGQGDLIDICGSALLPYDGMICDVCYSKALRGALGCSIEGELATLSWESVGQPRHLRLIGTHGGEEVVEVEETLPVSGELNLAYEVADFVAAIHGDYDLEAANGNSTIVAGIMEAIRYREGIVFPSDPEEIRG